MVLIRRREPAPDPHVDEHGRRRGNLLSEVRDGLRYVLGSPYLRAIAACTGTANFFSNIAFATLIVYAVRDLGLSAVEIGIVFGLGNIGAIIGAFTADRFRRALGLGRAIVVSAALGGPGVLLVALAPARGPDPVPRRVAASSSGSPTSSTTSTRSASGRPSRRCRCRAG